MSIDDKVNDEELIKVDKKEAMSAMYQALKTYNSQLQTILNAKSKVVNFMNEAQTMEMLGYKVNYYFDEKNKGYTFSYQDKNVAGFRNEID